MHIGIGINSLFNADIGDFSFVSPYETICNSITAEILVPASIFRGKWQNTTGELEKKIAEFAEYFKCSQTVIARRAYDFQFISSDDYRFLVSQVKQAIALKPASSGGDYYRTQASRIDRKFLLALNASLHEGGTLHTEAYRLTNTNRSTFEGLVREVLGERK